MDEITRFFSHDHRHCDELFVDLERALAQGDWTSIGPRAATFLAETEHHLGMEEGELFPLLEGSAADGPVRVMRAEHEQMRHLFAELRAALGRRDRQACLDVTETLLLLMQQHNAKEENILYPLADQTLGSAAHELVDRLRQAA
jgi:hemerythrin-like domain-containing protein